jgi:ATP-dependent DNA helicase PIF1
MVEDIQRTPEFDRALKMLEETREHVFITGRAGTGKSTLLRYFLGKTAQKVAVLAPTGIAALNVEGQTIHSFFQLPPRLLEKADLRPLGKQRRILETLETLIIDEISMVRADVLEAVDHSLRINRDMSGVPFGGVRMVFIGDLNQLPPVLRNEDRDVFANVYDSPYFFSSPAFKSIEPAFIELTVNFRQSHDPEFFHLLSRIGNHAFTRDDLERINERLLTDDVTLDPNEERITLTATNQDAHTVNQRRLSALSGAATEYKAIVEGEFDEKAFPTDYALSVKAGAQVMMLRNDSEKRWVNGDIGVVTQCNAEGLKVRIHETEHNVARASWEKYRYTYNLIEGRIDKQVVGSFEHYPLRLAWAITIHKSQGKTLKNVLVDIGSGGFAHGQVYVALSRCPRIEDLRLKRAIRATDIIFDETVKEFKNRVGAGHRPPTMRNI